LILLKTPAYSETQDARSNNRRRGRRIDSAAREGLSVIRIRSARDLRRNLAGNGIDVRGVKNVECSFQRLVFGNLERSRNPIVPEFDPIVTGDKGLNQDVDDGVQRIPHLNRTSIPVAALSIVGSRIAETER